MFTRWKKTKTYQQLQQLCWSFDYCFSKCVLTCVSALFEGATAVCCVQQERLCVYLAVDGIQYQRLYASSKWKKKWKRLGVYEPFVDFVFSLQLYTRVRLTIPFDVWRATKQDEYGGSSHWLYLNKRRLYILVYLDGEKNWQLEAHRKLLINNDQYVVTSWNHHKSLSATTVRTLIFRLWE